MPAALVAVEGFLIERDSIRGQHPIPEAMRLVGALTAAYKVILSSTSIDREKLDYLLTINGIVKGRTYDQVLIREVQWLDLSKPELHSAHFNHARVGLGMVSLYVDSDPDSCARVLYEGGNVLLWSRAQYLRPDFRPDRPKPTSWASLEKEAERQVFLRREDERLGVEHEESEFQ